MSLRTPNNNHKKPKTPPPEDTFEEALYLKMLGEKQKTVSVHLMDGEVVKGWIEYYDRNMIRLTREVCDTAADVPHMCIRALDYCPAIDITFGEYLRAIVTADRDLSPEDPVGRRVAFMQAFGPPLTFRTALGIVFIGFIDAPP